MRMTRSASRRRAVIDSEALEEIETATGKRVYADREERAAMEICGPHLKKAALLLLQLHQHIELDKKLPINLIAFLFLLIQKMHELL